MSSERQVTCEVCVCIGSRTLWLLYSDTRTERRSINIISEQTLSLTHWPQEKKSHTFLNKLKKKLKRKKLYEGKNVQYTSKKNARKGEPLNKISAVDSNPIVVYNNDMKRTVCIQSDQ